MIAYPNSIARYVESLREKRDELLNDFDTNIGELKRAQGVLRAAETILDLLNAERAKSKERPDYADFILAACRSTLGPCEPCVIDGQCGLRPVKDHATSIIVREDCASVWPDGTDAYFCETPDQLQALLDHVAAGTVPDVDAWHEVIR